MLLLKRVYEEPSKMDGFRILVDRLWPRGLSKDRASVDLWLKEIAPSDALRKWFSHDVRKWTGFKHRYFMELKGKKELVEVIRKKIDGEKVSLLYGAADKKHNNAAALKEYIERRGGRDDDH